MAIMVTKVEFFWISILCFFLPLSLFSQAITLQHQTTIAAAAVQMAVDPLGRIYAIDANNEVLKYDRNGKLLFAYNNNTIGQLKSIDATNPLSLLLFYEELQTGILLDRTMNLQYTYDFLSYNIPGIQVVAMANDRNIWLYDAYNFQLKLLNQSGEVIESSAPLNQLLPMVPQPNQLIAQGNWVYLNDPEQGIHLFDAFGQYHKTIPEPYLKHIQIIEETILATLAKPDEDHPQGIQLQWLLNQRYVFDFPDSILSAHQILFAKESLYALDHLGKIHIFNYQHP